MELTSNHWRFELVPGIMMRKIDKDLLLLVRAPKRSIGRLKTKHFAGRKKADGSTTLLPDLSMGDWEGQPVMELSFDSFNIVPEKRQRTDTIQNDQSRSPPARSRERRNRGRLLEGLARQ
jgi:hypothetical protein